MRMRDAKLPRRRASQNRSKLGTPKVRAHLLATQLVAAKTTALKSTRASKSSMEGNIDVKA
jgi:hypothetical protein